MAASGMIVLGLALIAAGPEARWIGQDGHDVVGPSSEPKGSDVQDIHIVLDHLPPERDVKRILVQGHGGDQWYVNGPPGPWRAALERPPRSSRADLYCEPSRVETGRQFYLKFDYDDGTGAEVYLQGGKADPNLRMANAALGAKWAGQGGEDRVGPGAAVGPDGIEDVRLALTGLSPRVEVKAATLEAPGGKRWESGVNPRGDANAELVRDPRDPARAGFFFHADRDLNGQTLTLTIAYANGKTDTATVVGERSEPTRPMPRPTLPTLAPNTIRGQWSGQDAGTGDVQVRLSDLPDAEVRGAVLGDPVRGSWVYRADDSVDLGVPPSETPLVFRRDNVPGRADLFFAPYRDESGGTMTLRLVFRDGTTTVARFPGGACDPALRVPGIAPGSVSAKPGDDLHDLVNRSGTVTLTPGTYALDKPLVLDHPVTLTGAPGAVLRFAQSTKGDPWTAAIKVHCGRTTLDNFAVRFAGSIRWRWDVAYGPAVIGVTDRFDRGHDELKVGLAFTRLDLESPPSSDPGAWQEAPCLIRLAGARSGRVTSNVLKGGSIELFDGPWLLEDNDYRGTVPGTSTAAVFATHYTHDLVVRKNRAKPVGPSGKTWRFLVMTGQGANDTIEDNTVESIGARDDDTIPWSNAPEIILTEAYHLHFEGKPSAVAPDGRIVAIPGALGRPPASGDVVSLLDGPDAGRWSRIAQVFGPTTYLVDPPLPSTTGVIAISTGFVGETFRGNIVDSRGGRRADNLVLPGNHFGTRIVNNRFLGGGEAVRLVAYATETPYHYGWSHVPFLDALVEGNLFEDASSGAVLGVDHGPNTKSDVGRTYMSLTLKDNTIRWTAAFLARSTRDGATTPPPGLVAGYRPALDPVELVVREQGDRLDAPPGTPSASAFRVHAALLNGHRIVDRAFTLPAAKAEGR